MYSILHGPLFFPPRKVPPYRRSERNTGTKKKHTAQLSTTNKAICSAQAALGIVKSLSAPNRGPLLYAPFTCFWLHSSLPCASVAAGVSRPRSGALVYHEYRITGNRGCTCDSTAKGYIHINLVWINKKKHWNQVQKKQRQNASSGTRWRTTTAAAAPEQLFYVYVMSTTVGAAAAAIQQQQAAFPV